MKVVNGSRRAFLTPDAPEREAARNLRAVIFDFDGTLSDTRLDFAVMRGRTESALEDFFKARNLGCLPVQAEGGTGAMPLMEELEAICQALSAGGEARLAAEARGTAMRAIVEVEMEAARQSSLFAFARPMLASLRSKGLGLGVITRNCPGAVLNIFPDAGRYLDCLLTREDVARVKPHPEHLLQALKRLDIAPDFALMVGDHPMDVEVGKRSGTFTAAVYSGESSRERLAAAGPDWLFEDAGELMRFLGLY